VVFGFFLFKLSGHVVIDASGIQDKYNLGDKINGTITMTLVPSEIIQKDTMINVKLLKNNNVFGFFKDVYLFILSLLKFP
jgi:hypothetical protein